MTTETTTTTVVVVAAAASAKLFSVFLSAFASECIIHLVGQVTSNLEDGKRENGVEHTKPLRGIRRRGRQSASCPSSLLSTCSHERSHVYISLLRVGGHPLPQGAVLKKVKKKRIDPTSQRPSASPLVWILCVCLLSPTTTLQTQKQTLLKKWIPVCVMALRDGQWFTRVFRLFVIAALCGGFSFLPTTHTQTHTHNIVDSISSRASFTIERSTTRPPKKETR